MMDINASDLRYFLEVARTLNISRASERLGIGQPGLSQSIRRLEAQMGTLLLNRYKTGVQLTPPGIRLATKGAQLLEQWTKLKEDVLASHSEIEGKYILGCHPSVALYSLPAFFRDLIAKNPKLEIKLAHGLSREITEDIVSFRVDFGIVVNPIRHPDLVIRELCRDKVCFWVAKNCEKDVLIYDPKLIQSQFVIEQATKRGCAFKRHIESSHLEVIGALAEAGTGVAILPERVGKRHPRLTRYRAELPSFEDKICLAYRMDRKTTAAARLIVDTIARAKF